MAQQVFNSPNQGVPGSHPSHFVYWKGQNAFGIASNVTVTAAANQAVIYNVNNLQQVPNLITSSNSTGAYTVLQDGVYSIKGYVSVQVSGTLAIAGNAALSLELLALPGFDTYIVDKATAEVPTIASGGTYTTSLSLSWVGFLSIGTGFVPNIVNNTTNPLTILASTSALTIGRIS